MVQQKVQIVEEIVPGDYFAYAHDNGVRWLVISVMDLVEYESYKGVTYLCNGKVSHIIYHKNEELKWVKLE
jgi:hypothetical protein